MGSSDVTGGDSGQRNEVIDDPKLKRGGGNDWPCGVTDGGQCRYLVWHRTMGKGMGVEGESSGLKRKEYLLSVLVVSNSWAGVQSNEGNESRRKMDIRDLI
jgi:hypothetical protein